MVMLLRKICICGIKCADIYYFIQKIILGSLKNIEKRLGLVQKLLPLGDLKTGGLTGWYGNLETGLNFPTREPHGPITKHIGLKYDDVVPKFRNQKTRHSVWNYDNRKKIKKLI